MNLNDLHQLLLANIQNKTREYIRLFHGRGNFYDGYPFLTVDSADRILFATFFTEDAEEGAIIAVLQRVFESEQQWDALIIQKRYRDGAPSEVVAGAVLEATFAFEDHLKFTLNFLNSQNIGFFPDMKRGRTFVRENAQGKKVLNLFAYTCSFSVAAILGGAQKVVNVDMNKGVLSTGRENHRINGADTKKVEFMPYNILKSWSRIRKGGPYDLIIIDPPSFQKGSFAATSDYAKIIRRLDELAAPECTVLSALNAPELGSDFIKTLFRENAPEFGYVERLENLESFPSRDEERSLKNLIFKKGEAKP